MKLKKYAHELPKSMAQLKAMSPDALRELWSCYFPSGRPQIKPLWWQIQCEHDGIALEPKHLARLNTYSQDPDGCVGRSNKVKYHIKPGTQLIKKFKGVEHIVNTLAPDKFTYGGKVYKTLSGVAMEICGHKVSGYDFFGFNNKNNGVKND